MTNQEAIDILKCDISADKQGIEYCHDEVGIEALDMAIKALEQNESAEEWYKLFVEKLEQEPFINKPCISQGGCREDKAKVLDKIRAEIVKRKSTIDKAISEDELKIEGLKEAYIDCLEIIDKYKAEGSDIEADKEGEE